MRSRLPGSVEDPEMERSLCIHDKILLEAPIEATNEVALILKETMVGTGKTLLKTVPVEAQVVIVDSWSQRWGSVI
jgi:DNA polymerase I-like protein with 3'-5' exonuclease and polymerase domains